MTGRAMRGNRIAHGDFGLVTLEPAWITAGAARIAMTRYIKRGGQVWIKFSRINRLLQNLLKLVWVLVKVLRVLGSSS